MSTISGINARQVLDTGGRPLVDVEVHTSDGLISIPSGRSGGVVDDIVMDLAVGLQAPFQKNGAPRSGERIEKLNFLTRAAEEIGDCRLADLTPLARFADPAALPCEARVSA